MLVVSPLAWQEGREEVPQRQEEEPDDGQARDDDEDESNDDSWDGGDVGSPCEDDADGPRCHSEDGQDDEDEIALLVAPHSEDTQNEEEDELKDQKPDCLCEVSALCKGNEARADETHEHESQSEPEEAWSVRVSHVSPSLSSGRAVERWVIFAVVDLL